MKVVNCTNCSAENADAGPESKCRECGEPLAPALFQQSLDELKRLTAKVQVSTAGKTSFASLGAEWRQHAFKGRIYAQVGIGVTIHDGYRYLPNPFLPGLDSAEAWRRYEIYQTRTGFGSRVLFNPNASIGVRIDRRWAVEATWEHFSHRQLFSDVNPGIDNVGIRLVRALGR